MIEITKEYYTGIVRWNGNHYFSGDWVKGPRVYKDTDFVFIEDELEDAFGNDIGCIVEVFPESLQLVEEENR